MYAPDTIVALATPPGRGGIGVVRLSGADSLALAAELFRASQGSDWHSHRLRHGWLLDSHGRALDEGLAVWMQGPRSYTGEDVVELQGHGSPAVLRRVVEAALAAGARLAERGEFTQRAFLNGRLDLAQAEAVIDLIEARSAAAAALAADQLRGTLSVELARVRSDLIDLKALLEAQIDFSDEDITIDRDELLTLAQRANAALATLIGSYAHGKRVREGLRVAIVGRPNVGKSSLLNALLGEERAIVTAVAGTTRDVIEEGIEIDGLAVVLSDTAGLRPTGEADVVERLGIARTAVAVEQADLVLVVIDGTQRLGADDLEVMRVSAGKPRLLVVNKNDLDAQIPLQELREPDASCPVVRISAKARTGLDELRAQIAAMIDVEVRAGGTEAVLTNLRHRDALQRASEALAVAVAGIAAGDAPDLVAVAVQDALDQAGEVTGAVSGEDVLDRVFSRFCIGK